MGKTAVLALFAAGIFAASAAPAEEQPWIVKAGAHYLMPKGNPGSIDDNGTKLDLEVDDGLSFTFTIAYMFDEHWALELLGSAPFQHDINLKGNGKIAETDLLPPTVSALYYFNPGGRVRPYLGAGVNFTEFFSEKPDDLHLKGSIGPAATAGLDVLFTRHWFATIDLRYIYVKTDVQAEGSSHDYGTLELNPFAAGVMFGYRFGGREPTQAAAPVVPVAAPVAAAPPPPPAPAAKCSDADGDGVCDADDRCPSTPAGDTVDKFGCSLVSRLAVYFDFDSAELRPESITELERVVGFMNDIPTVTALIEGYTDSVGSDAYNLALSDRRAKAVYDYLASRGVNPARLQSLGKGEADPVGDNATEAGRQLNRRVMLIRTDGGR
jgi:outer membrane protein W/outer membrane protein OmpA-like peptidoglycan-associated protein